jgi:uncharacterized membrane protein YccF (DUF307 family)
VRTLLNVIWLVLSGFWLALGYAAAGILMFLLIITIPFGIASTIGNVLWFLLVGLWMAIAHVVLGVVLCLTVIGIPLGVANIKLAAVAIAPLGKEIVPSSDPRAALGTVSF